MIIEFWSRFGESPAWGIMSFSASALWIVYVIAQMIHGRAVKGTVRSFKAATVVKTLCLPLFGAYVFKVAMHLFTGDWFSVLIELVVCYLLIRGWKRIKGNDDWWKGKGTRLKRRLASLIGGRSPAPAADTGAL